MQVMEFKRKAALRTSSLHDAHSELESIARQADEADLSAPDEVTALSMLIDERNSPPFFAQNPQQS